MKNKTKTYLLIAAVLGIWGTITFKIINGINPDAPEIAQLDFDETFNPKTIKKSESFTIESLDRDPFLGTLSNNKKKSSKTIQKFTKKDDKFPSVLFNGIVKKQNTSNQVFVISINNTQHLLKKGQKVDSITLVKGNEKEIVIRFKKRLQTIKRQ